MSILNPKAMERADSEARFETKALADHIVQTTKLLIEGKESVSQILENQIVIMTALLKLLYKQVFDEEIKNSK